MTRHVRRASITAPIHLQHLNLHPIPVDSLPAADSAEHAARSLEIVAEAKLLIASPLWTPPKTYYDGLITTSSLAPEATTHRPVAEGAELPVSDSGKSKRLSLWGGGKKAVRESTEGISWHLRSVRLTDEWATVYPGIHFEQFWSALAERHIEQEVEYVETLGSVVPLPNSCFLKLFNLPFPTTNRSFLVHFGVIPTTPPATPSNPNPLRSFITFSLPVSSPPHKEEKGHIRGQFVAVEEVREELNERDEVEIVWRCASQSTLGGSIPIRVGEVAMPSSIASQGASFFAWLALKHSGTVPVSSQW